MSRPPLSDDWHSPDLQPEYRNYYERDYGNKILLDWWDGKVWRSHPRSSYALLFAHPWRERLPGGLCQHCNGSGEGQTDGSICRHCKGSGTQA